MGKLTITTEKGMILNTPADLPFLKKVVKGRHMSIQGIESASPTHFNRVWS